VKRLVISALALAVTMTAAAADTPTFNPAHLSADVKTLSSDAFEGRGPATVGETKTLDFLIAQYKAAGLQPGGDLKDGKRGWTQAVPLLRSEFDGTPTFTVTVNGKAESLKQGEQIAVRAALNGAQSVNIQDAPLVFVGYGVKAPERNWDDFKGVDLHGKIAVVLINDPDYETGVGDFGGKAMTYYGRWTYKYEEAARQGAAGILIVHETGPASYGWDTVKNSNTNAMFDVVHAKPGDVHPALEAWIQRDVAVDLFKRAGLDFKAQKKLAQTREFKPVALNGESFSAHFNVNHKTITSYNVVARVPGSKHPDETVIYSAHWDHLGVGQPDASGDRIYHGAVDNGTGTAAVLELARAFAKGPKPERSVVFLNFTAEEKGLLGSEYYAANPLYPLGKTVGVINMDALDPYGPARNFTISGSAKLDLLDDLIATAKRWNVTYSADPKPEAGHFFRSDHFSFAKRGVPAISFQSGDDWVNGGLAAGKAYEDLYVAKHYHQPSDKWEANWPFTGMARDLQMLYTLGNELANSEQWPNWAKDSEFRAARDATAADRK
jgi:Zn-dependent M28 family amino/carboxypeptidase